MRNLYRTKLRKWTTPLHLLLGLLCAGLIPYYPIASVILFLWFGFDEYWEWKIMHDTGEQDFWEGLVSYTIGIVIILALRLGGML